MLKNIPEPWRSFLADLDSQLPEPIVVHCIGGFAINLSYGFPRPTKDIDVCEVAPGSAKKTVQELAGENSALHDKHKVYVQIVTMATLPYDYEDRLTEITAGMYRNIRLLVLEAHDLALSKIGRNSDRDIEDVKYLGRAVPLDLELLRTRFTTELETIMLGNPETARTTLQLWCDAIEEERQAVNTTPM